MTRKRRWVMIAARAIVALYLVGLAWGYVRLPWAAIDNLANYKLVTMAPAVTIDRSETSISRIQEKYLMRQLRESPTPTTPRIHVRVRWNALVCACVAAGHYSSPDGAEWKNTLFVNVFGAWVPMYTFSDVMA